MITIHNNFHNTSVNVRASIGDELTATQVNRVRRELCGIRDCCCGGSLKERGPLNNFIAQDLTDNFTRRVILLSSDY